MFRSGFALGVRAAIACASIITLGHAQDIASSAAADARGEIRAEREVQPERPLVSHPKARLANPSRVASVVLSRPASTGVEKSASSGDKPGVALQIGFGRAVPELENFEAAAARLDWERLSNGGQVAALSLTSPQASAIRAGLRIHAIPAEALLRFYAPGQGEVLEVTGQEVQETLARNLAAGEQGEDASTYWSPVIDGPTVVVEFELPDGASAGNLVIAAPVISHLLTSPALEFAMPSTKAAESCNVDVMCYQGTWGAESDAVARIVYTSGGSSYLCSGTLLVDKVPATSIPFLLTANHCVSTQTSASSLQSYWFYRSTSCNSGVRGASQTLAGGATLLYNSATTDTALLRLNGTPPAGAVYAGWIVGAAPSIGANVVGIHHPRGDLQKISLGRVSDYVRCTASSGGEFSCGYGSSATGTFYEAVWTSGTTEPGSSGSGLFLENGRYLVGQLYGGSQSCTTTGAEFYGRFDVAYNAGLANFLGGAATSGGSTVTPPPSPTVFTPALNYSALWWNPAESGWGLSVTQHNAAIFAAWFVYSTSGNPMWVVMPGGTWTSPTTFAGDLYSTSGPPSNGVFDPSRVSSARIGTATLAFSSADTGVLSYSVAGVPGTKAIRRQAFGVFDTAPVAAYGDLWWNAREPGWGLSINQQYRTLFAVWYTYGLYGQPIWYVLPGGSWIGDVYTGTLYRTTAAPGEFFKTPFDPGTVAGTPVGSMSLRFHSVNDATLSYTIDAVADSKAITRQTF